jgi:hypothetical protein
LQPQYEQVAQLWRSYGCCFPTQPKLPLKCRVLVLSPQTILPELPDPKTTQKPAGPSSRTLKMPRKIAKAARPIFKTKSPKPHQTKSSINSVINERHLKGAATIWILNRCPHQLRKNQPFGIY